MEDDAPPLAPIPRRMSTAPLSPLTSPPMPRAHRPARSAGSRYSTGSSITSLPEYTTSPPARTYGKSFTAMQDVWPPPMEDTDPLPDYKSPPPTRTYHQTRSSIAKVGVSLDIPPPAPEDTNPEPFATQFTALSPRNRRVGHRRHTSTSTWRSAESADEELDSRLDQLVERSVAALEISNHLLSHSISSSPTTPLDRPRSAETLRARRRERMSLPGTGRRWVDEHIMEEDEDEEAWEESTFTGSLPEQSYLSTAYRPQLPRMSSHSSLVRSPSEPSLDGYQFPRPQHPYGPSHQFPERASPVPSIPRSDTRTPTRPAPLNLSSADLGAPQVSTPSFHPSTPAYKLVSEIVSREALQRRTPSGSQVSGSQPSTPQATTPGLPISRSSQSPTARRDSSADPPKHRRRGTLTASISVPQDIGKWIRSLEPRSSARLAEPAPTPAAVQEVVAPIPQRPKIINPQLPPSPPRTVVTMSTSPPSTGEEPVPLSRSISQLRAILSSQPAPPTPIAAPIPKRPQFRPMTPQVTSTALTRPPPTPRSESTPPHTDAVMAIARESPVPVPSPVPSAIRKFRASRHDRHVSFSPTPTEIPSRATSPPPDDPTLTTPAANKPSGWSLMNWLMPSQPISTHKETKKQKKKKDDDESAGMWRTRAWLQEGRQGWNERMADSWQV
ncbi:hypothetical protein CALVIDRAFT_533778 [Calocera viscosa TUFC12733]|uniref:Uncharacterized protein n=1 Tax=Calocera viscosa (strain TUFC12733) TaxID=1330018 RepID=A0A167QPW0_CALVF|nr:hypothetical protein CALVIDRAFT_533778 [Calocera viscosa TUFC12733]